MTEVGFRVRESIYALTAALVGVLWYLALLIPLSTREQLAVGGLGRDPVVYSWRLLLVCAVSVALALIFRRWIVSASTPIQAAVRGLALPLVGTVLFSWGLARSVPPTNVLMTPVLGIWLVVYQAFYVVIPMGLVSQGVMARVGRGSRPTQDRRFWRFASIVVLASLGLMVWIKQKDGVHHVTRTMSWRIGEEDPSHRARHVVLTFVDHRDEYIGIYSDDLAKYLESRSPGTVPVSFEVTYRLRSMSGYHETQIGELTQWSAIDGYGSASEAAFR